MGIKKVINDWLDDGQSVKAEENAQLLEELKSLDSSWTLMEMFSSGQAQWFDPTSTNFAKEGFVKNVIAYRCIDMVSDGVACIDLKLHNNKGVEIPEHPLLDLLHRPNPGQGQASFLYKVQMFKMISGNTYIHSVRPNKNQPPRELFALRTDRMTIVPGAHRIPKGYKFKISDSKNHFYPVDPTNGKSDILHMYYPHPLDDWYGLSPLQSAQMSVEMHNESSEWNKKLLQNGARPSGLLSTDQDLTQEQRERLRDALNESYVGAANSGRPYIGGGGLKWQEMGLSPKDVDYLNGRTSSAIDVANAFGVPAVLLHLPDSSSTYNNVKEAKLDLFEGTVLPEMDLLMSELNHWLVPMFGEGLTLTYDTNSISALQPRREIRWEKAQKSDFLTINEKRELLGFDAIDGGDVILQPTSVMPLESIVDDDVDDNEEDISNENENDETATTEETEDDSSQDVSA